MEKLTYNELEEANTMCNLSEGIYEKGIKEGTEHKG